MFRLAIVANLGLSDFASLYKHGVFITAPCASVYRLFHLWDGVTTSDNNAFQGNQFVDLEGIQFADLITLIHVERCHLDDSIALILLHDASLIRLD